MPQLLHLILPLTITKHTESSLVTPKVVEYREGNLRPFLIIEYIYRPSLLFSSAHRFRSGDWDDHGRSLILCSVNHLCLDLDVLDHCPAGTSNDDLVLVSDITCPGISWSSWCHVSYHGSQSLWRKNSPTTSGNLHLHHTYIQVMYRHSSFYAKPTLRIGCRKARFSFHLTIEHGSSQSSSSILWTPGGYVCGEIHRKGFFWHAFPIICWHGCDI